MVVAGIVVAVNQKNQGQQNKKERIVAATIPHHLVGRRLVEELAVDLLAQKTKKIYLLGPNHYETGEGELVAEQEMCLGLVKQDEETIKNDHAFGPVAAVFKEKISGVEVVSIAVSNRTDKEDLDRLEDCLVEELEVGSVLVGSIDFSHYLPLVEANKRDEVSWDKISNKKYDEIAGLSNEYLDSPKSLLVIMRALDKMGGYEIRLKDRSNSELESGQTNLGETTSYLRIEFFGKENSSSLELSRSRI